MKDKIIRHSYLCKFPLNLWTFINDQAAKKYITVAAYINQLVLDDFNRVHYGEEGLFTEDNSDVVGSDNV